MFTIEEIIAAHSKVKSGADFPKYIKDLTALGVMSYSIYVNDGHEVYHSITDDTIQSGKKYVVMEVAELGDLEQFNQDLKNHQNGQTDYFTFCRDAAKSGVEKWTVDTKKMTCIYYDKLNNEMLIEKIPRI